MKAALHNLGCKVNAYETEAMQQILEEAGYEIVPFSEYADVYVINTCSVTNMADRKSRQMLHRAKKQNPDAIVVGAGCYVQTKEAQALVDESIDIVIGNNKKHELVSLLQEYEASHRKTARVADINHEKQAYEELSLSRTAEHTRAFIKVQDGCNQFCAYCIIPYVRGRIRSRSIEDTVKEVTDFARRGYHEVVLTGIHLSSYGLDFDHANYEYAMNHEIPSTHLLALIRAVAAVPGIARVRLGSLEPRIITEPFVEALRAIPELCPHFHLSLQSGSDRILSAMNRHYDTAAFRHSVALLRAAWPEVAITTDVIVGFPGESDADFEDSYRFVEEIGFYELHVFKYSRRQGTVADRMPGQLTDRVKSERSERLMKLDTQQSEAFRCRFLGRTEDVIPEEIVRIEGRPYLRGYNRCYVRYLIPLSDATEGACKIGQIMQVCGQEICGGCVLALGL